MLIREAMMYRKNATDYRRARGFTLIELLVVVAIVGILAAISIPYYGHYKMLAYDAQAESDLRNGVVAEEAAYVVADTYVSCSDSGCVCSDPTNPVGCVTANQLPGLRVSRTVRVEFSASEDNEGAPFFTAQSYSVKGSGTVFSFDSREGTVLSSSDPPN